MKQIGKEQPQSEQCNTPRDTDGRFSQNDEQTSDTVEQHCQGMSKLKFSNDYKLVKKGVSNIIRSYRSNI